MKRLLLTGVLLLCYLLSLPQSPCQPVLTTLTAPAKNIPGIGIKIVNTSSRPFSNLSIYWEVILNGAIVQKGRLPIPPIASQHAGTIRLPVKIPINPGEVFLNVYYRSKKPGSPAAGLIAWEQLSLRKYNDDLSIRPAGELSFTDEGGSFTITSPATTLNLQFNKQTGWLQHFAMGDRLLAADSSGLITDLGEDASGQAPRLQLFSTSTSTDLAVVKADYLIPETPFLLHARYTVNARGEMQLEQFLEVDTTLPRDTTTAQPALKYPPLLSMKWTLPSAFDSIWYYGEVPITDSCRNSKAGVSNSVLKDTGTWTGIRWWKCTDGQQHGLLISADSSLLDIRISGRQINIDHPLTGAGTDTGNHHYMYKVTPQ